MNIENECLVCIYNQALKSAKNLNCDAKTTKKILNDTAKILIRYDLDVTPPFIAKDVYKKISKRVGIDDPLKNIKKKSTKEAVEEVFEKEFIYATRRKPIVNDVTMLEAKKAKS